VEHSKARDVGAARTAQTCAADEYYKLHGVHFVGHGHATQTVVVVSQGQYRIAGSGSARIEDRSIEASFSASISPINNIISPFIRYRPSGTSSTPSSRL